MRKKKPRVAKLGEVRISRDGEDAIIEFIDATIATTHLKLGLEVHETADQEIERPVLLSKGRTKARLGRWMEPRGEIKPCHVSPAKCPRC